MEKLEKDIKLLRKDTAAWATDENDERFVTYLLVTANHMQMMPQADVIPID